MGRVEECTSSGNLPAEARASVVMNTDFDMDISFLFRVYINHVLDRLPGSHREGCRGLTGSCTGRPLFWIACIPCRSITTCDESIPSFARDKTASTVRVMNRGCSGANHQRGAKFLGRILTGTGATSCNTCAVACTMISHSVLCSRSSYASIGSSFLISTSRTMIGSPRSTSFTTR